MFDIHCEVQSTGKETVGWLTKTAFV